MFSNSPWWNRPITTGNGPFRSTTGGYVFTGVCLFNFWMDGGGVPHLADRGYSIPGLDGGGNPIQLTGGYLILLDREGYPIPGPDGGYPIPGLDGGVPHPADRGVPIPGLGGYPISGLDRGYPILGWGVPHPRSGLGGTSSQVWTGGTHPRSGQWEYPGVPPFPARTRWGTPPFH